MIATRYHQQGVPWLIFREVRVCVVGGGLYNEVRYIMGDGHMGTPSGQTDRTEQIIFTQLRWRAVTNCKKKKKFHHHPFKLLDFDFRPSFGM